MYVIVTNQSCRILADSGDLRELLWGKMFWDFEFALYAEESFEDPDNWLPLEDSDGRYWTHHFEAEDETVTVYDLPGFATVNAPEGDAT